MSKLSPLPRFAPKALQLALAAGVLSLATAQGAMAQEKVLRIAMTAADIPRTLGQPDLRKAIVIRADIGPALEFPTTEGTTRAMFPIVGGAAQGKGWTARILPGDRQRQVDAIKAHPDAAEVLQAEVGGPLAIGADGELLDARGWLGNAAHGAARATGQQGGAQGHAGPSHHLHSLAPRSGKSSILRRMVRAEQGPHLARGQSSRPLRRA